MNCKICSGETRKIYDWQFDLNYYRCTNCDVIFAEDRKLPTEIIEKADYEKHDNNMENKGYVKMMNNFISSAIEPLDLNDGDVLEFGCGHGPVLATLLEEKGMVVDKYDIFFYPEKVYEDKQYDLITSTEVIEHLSSPMEVFTLFHKHLKPGGYLALTTLFHPESDSEFLEWYYRREISHIVFYNEKTFETISNQLGFQIIESNNKNIIVLRKVANKNE